MAATKAKLAEGDKHLKLGDKSVKTTLLRWKPDWETAAFEYEQAVKCYRGAMKDGREKLIHTTKKLAEAHYENGTKHLSAKSLEECAQVCEKVPDCKEDVSELLSTAALYHRENDHPDAAVQCFLKAARFHEETDVDRAIEIYKNALDAVEEDERGNVQNDTYNKIVAYCARKGRLEDTYEILTRQVKMHTKHVDLFLTYRRGALFGQIVVLLALKDFSAAQALFAKQQQYLDYIQSEEAQAVNRLLEAYASAENEAVTKVAKMQIFELALMNQVCRIARKLKASAQKIEFRGFMDEAAPEEEHAAGADELEEDSDDLA